MDCLLFKTKDIVHFIAGRRFAGIKSAILKIVPGGINPSIRACKGERLQAIRILHLAVLQGGHVCADGVYAI